MSHEIDFEALFQSSPNPYMLLDRDLRYVAVNRAYERVTGVAAGHLVGRPILEVFPNDPGDPNNESAQRLRASLRNVLETGEPDALAFIPYRVPRDGDGDDAPIRYWSATHTPVRNKDGEVAFVLQHTVDVTQLHVLRSAESAGSHPQLAAGILDRAARVEQANAELKRAQDELQARAALERQLIGIVSHDLRNPLNAIGIGAALLKESSLDPRQRKVVDRMMSSFDRAARLIRDFLDFTQTRVSGRIPVSRSQANIREIAQAACDEVQPAYPDRRCVVEYSGREVGEWDPDRLVQLAGNLVSNAFRHSPPDEAVIPMAALRAWVERQVINEPPSSS